MKSKPDLSVRTLWDVDLNTLSYDDSAEWIIERVFDRGSLAEVLSVVKYYGKERVEQHLKSTQGFLPNHSILLAKAIFGLRFTDFKCLEKRPFLPGY